MKHVRNPELKSSSDTQELVTTTKPAPHPKPQTWEVPQSKAGNGNPEQTNGLHVSLNPRTQSEAFNRFGSTAITQLLEDESKHTFPA